jgi:hypothetical protein
LTDQRPQGCLQLTPTETPPSVGVSPTARRRHSARTLACVAVAGVALAAGCGGSEDGAGDASRVPPKLVETTTVEGGTPDKRQLVRRVLDGMEQTALTRIQIAGANKGGKKAVAIQFTPVSGQTARRQWDQWIVAGALSRRLLAADAPALVDGSDNGATFRARPRIEGNPDPKPLPAAREQAILKGIRSAVTRSGAELVALEAHRPYGLAIALSLATDDPARFLAEELRPLLTSLGAHRRQTEGIYLGVLDERRRIVLEWGSWTRNPAGTFWVRRDLEDCSPIRQSGPPGTEPPPPCPAK